MYYIFLLLYNIFHYELDKSLKLHHYNRGIIRPNRSPVGSIIIMRKRRVLNNIIILRTSLFYCQYRLTDRNFQQELVNRRRPFCIRCTVPVSCRRLSITSRWRKCTASTAADRIRAATSTCKIDI